MSRGWVYNPRLGEDEAIFNADGRALCEECGLPFSRHPFDPDILDWQGEPFLRRACDGELLKL